MSFTVGCWLSLAVWPSRAQIRPYLYSNKDLNCFWYCILWNYYTENEDEITMTMAMYGTLLEFDGVSGLSMSKG